MKIGKSRETILKVRQIAKVLPVLLTMSRRSIGSYGGRFRLIDLNAACGQYEVNGELLDGSALIMAKFANELNLPVEVTLVERDPTLCAELVRHMESRNYRLKWEVLCGDNRVLGPEVCARGSSRDRGLVLFDPNGPDNQESGSMFTLATTLSRLPAMRGVDFLLHIPTSTIKLMHLAGKKINKGSWATRDTRLLLERLLDINKKHWMAREPYGQLNWTFMFMANYRWRNGWAKEGFYWTDTPEGQDLLMRLSRIGQSDREAA